jgi:glycosyltransferase involved in cell wall biosynthesis
LRVAYYSPSAATTHVGGVETFVREISACLSQIGVQVSIITGLGEISPNFIPFQSCFSNIYYLPFLQRYLRGNNMVCRVASKLGHEITPYTVESYSMIPLGTIHFVTHSYDIIAVHGLSDLFLRLCTGRTPFIFHYHGGHISPFHIAFLKRLPIFCIITCSSYLQSKLQELGIKCHIEQVHNGVDPNFFRPDVKLREWARESLGIGNRKMILYAGRFTPEKEVELAIYALASIRKSVEACLVVVGSGPLKDSYIRLARRLGVSSDLIVLEGVSQRLLLSYYNAADVFVLPCSRETFGIVLVEAQACGLPVVAANSGGVPEVVRDGQTGLLFEAGSQKALASSLLNILLSDNRREEMGLKGRQNILRYFTWHHAAQKLLKIYNSAVE